MTKLKKIIKITWRGIILTFRETFTGLMLGISALLILIKLTPGGYVNVGYLVMFGILAGFMKGLSKFLIMELFNKIPADEYSKNYPKYKMLFMWSVIFVAAAFVNYGLDITRWLAEPAKLIQASALVGPIPFEFILAGLWAIAILGILSYLYEPSYKN